MIKILGFLTPVLPISVETHSEYNLTLLICEENSIGHTIKVFMKNIFSAQRIFLFDKVTINEEKEGAA